VGAGLLIRSFVALQRVNPGFDADDVLTFELSMPFGKYPGGPARRTFFRQLREQLQTLPGVKTVAIGSDAPFVGGWSAAMMSVDGITKDRVRFYIHRTTPGFFTTLGISLLQGRDFTTNDRAGTPPVVIVSEATARRFWPNREAVGQRIRIGGPQAPEFTVVGVAANARFRDLTGDLYAPRAEPDVYFPLAQRTNTNLALAMRVEGDPTTYVKALQTAVRGVDAGVPTFAVAPLSDNLRAVSATSRFASIAMGAFSVVALALAAIGIYGVMAYLVAMGRREIAIRMALGGERGDVVRMVLRLGLQLVGAGLAIGVTASFATNRLLRSQLWNISPNDPMTFATAIGAVLLIAIVACWVPARRAVRVEPMVALRHE